MTDRLKLSDLKKDPEADEVAKELILKDQLDNKIRKLERSIATTQAEIAKAKQTSSTPKKSGSNKLGARKEGSFKAISTAPSINKTPIGPSMVPIPYPTTQDLSNSTNTACSVNFNGCPAYVLDATTQPRCTGDEAGTGKGVKSATISGEVKPVEGSPTVRIEGKKIVRHGDPCTMNGGNNPGIYVVQISISSSSLRRVITCSNPRPVGPIETLKSELVAWIRKKGGNVGEAVRHPRDGIEGAARGLANIPSQVTEFLLKAAAEQRATELREAANIQNVFGQPGVAKNLEGVADATRQASEKIDLPKFRMKNAAQEGGDTISVIAQITAGSPRAIQGLLGIGKTIVEAAKDIRASVVVAESAGSFFKNAKLLRESVFSTRSGDVTAITSSVSPPVSNGVKIRSRSAEKDVFHATMNDKNQVSSILKAIDPKYLSPDSRFGKAFYVADEPGTTLSELKHHGIDPTHGIRYTMDGTAMNVLDLTKADIASKYGYFGGPISSETQAIGRAARRDGFNVIRFYSERDPGKINNAVISDFNEILKPQIVTPVKK